MTPEEIKQACLDELLYKEDFLMSYQEDLRELASNVDFMRIINKCGDDVLPDIIFPSNKDNPEHKEFKQKYLYDSFVVEKLNDRFPAYRRIYTAVRNQGKTGLSAIISIYYGVRYLTVNAISCASTSDAAVAVVTDKIDSDLDFRKKWPAKYRCDDGHYVRSKNEQLVDNWLYHHGVCHAYEVLVVDREKGMEYISDFYLPHMNTYMEIWGFETPEYLSRKKKKTAAYKNNGLKLIEMTDAEIKILDDYLRRILYK